MSADMLKPDRTAVRSASVALLTGGTDKPYALGLASALSDAGVTLDFIGSDELNCPAVHAIPNLRFLNLRGDQERNASVVTKASRVVVYYIRLLRYVATTGCPTLHILWNSRFEWFDRTLVMAYYKACGRKVVLTAHNVNAAARDGRDSWFNRLSLRIQYRLCDHIFVHTDAMKRELVSAFEVPDRRVTVIPFGINDTIPKSDLSRAAARQSLGLEPSEPALLAFGQIAPYKGLQYLIDAIGELAAAGERVRLIVAGKIKPGYEDYWRAIEQQIVRLNLESLIVRRIQFIPDSEVESYFKAADAAVLPYVSIFQSGVPFLAFSFGLPVIATDVGSLRDDVTENTGLLCSPADGPDLARAIRGFFCSRLHRDAATVRPRIRAIAAETHSWAIVARRSIAVYRLLEGSHSSAAERTDTDMNVAR